MTSEVLFQLQISDFKILPKIIRGVRTRGKDDILCNWVCHYRFFYTKYVKKYVKINCQKIRFSNNEKGNNKMQPSEILKIVVYFINL